MCGRFALSIIPARFRDVFGCAPPADLWPRYNVAPDSAVVVVRAAGEGGAREAAWVRWGMLGPWMREAGDPGRQINARAETAAEKPMFRDAFRRSRCLIPASGFYEWQKGGSGPSKPFFVGLGSGEPLAFAGLWRRGRLEGGEAVGTCAILTTAASPLLRPVHHRMPVMLPESAWDAWLDPAVTEPEFLRALLGEPLPDGALAVREVGRAVNNPRNDGPSLVEPAPADDAPAGGDEPPAQGKLL